MGRALSKNGPVVMWHPPGFNRCDWRPVGHVKRSAAEPSKESQVRDQRRALVLTSRARWLRPDSEMLCVEELNEIKDSKPWAGGLTRWTGPRVDGSGVAEYQRMKQV